MAQKNFNDFFLASSRPRAREAYPGRCAAWGVSVGVEPRYAWIGGKIGAQAALGRMVEQGFGSHAIRLRNGVPLQGTLLSALIVVCAG
jgi:hypothetical protein